MRKVYGMKLDGIRHIPQDFLLQYCRSNDVGIYVDVSDEYGFLYTKSSIQIYIGREKVTRIRKQVTEELDGKELLR